MLKKHMIKRTEFNLCIETILSKKLELSTDLACKIIPQRKVVDTATYYPICRTHHHLNSDNVRQLQSLR